MDEVEKVALFRPLPFHVRLATILKPGELVVGHIHIIMDITLEHIMVVREHS